MYMAKAKKINNEKSLMLKLLEQKGMEIKQYFPGDLVDGVVVSVTHGELLLDVGAKSEGIITGVELG